MFLCTTRSTVRNAADIPVPGVLAQPIWGGSSDPQLRAAGAAV